LSVWRLSIVPSQGAILGAARLTRHMLSGSGRFILDFRQKRLRYHPQNLV